MSTTTQTLTLQLKFKEQLKDEEKNEEQKKKKPEIHVTWTEDTVDNENMGKKKSNSELNSMLHLSPTERPRRSREKNSHVFQR